jgi:hypothetical protein
MLVFIVSVMIGGVLEVDHMRLAATSDLCVQEHRTLAAVNRANRAAGVDVVYFGECRG